MQKLLIVLAIQFCLPLAAELLHHAIPASTWILPVVLVNAVGLGCALGVMWPRWRWVLLAALIAGVFLPIWLKAYQISQSEFFAKYPSLNFSDRYYWYVGRSSLLACCITIVLAYHYQLIWQRSFTGKTQPRAVYQFTLRNFFYYSGCAAVIAGATVRLYDSSARELLGIPLGDLCMIGMTMIMFWHLLQRSINWLNFGCCFLLMWILWSRVYDITYLYTFPLHKKYVFFGTFLAFCTLTVMLNRWAGFRIVPRSELALNSPPPGTALNAKTADRIGDPILFPGVQRAAHTAKSTRRRDRLSSKRS